jgi:hypothetical protein
LEMIRALMNKKELNLVEYSNRIKAMSLQHLAIVKRLNKDPEEYTSAPQHLIALGHSKTHMPNLDPNIYNSNIVRMLYVKSQKHIAMELAIDEDVKQLPDDFVIDYDRYIVFYLLKKMQEVYEIFGWDKISNVNDYLLSLVYADPRFMKKYEGMFADPENDKYDALIKKAWSILSKKKKGAELDEAALLAKLEVTVPVIEKPLTGDYFGSDEED